MIAETLACLDMAHLLAGFNIQGISDDTAIRGIGNCYIPTDSLPLLMSLLSMIKWPSTVCSQNRGLAEPDGVLEIGHHGRGHLCGDSGALRVKSCLVGISAREACKRLGR